MKRLFATLAAVVLVSAPVLADLTITTTMKMEGGAAALVAAAGDPRMTMRIKGKKGRNDFEAGAMTASSIVDLVARQMIMLDPATKTARVIDSTTKPSADAVPVPKIDASTKPTGQTREIDGRQCDEYAFTMSMDMSTMAGGTGRGQLPPETAEVMKDVRILMSGSIWVTRAGPGMEEYMAFQKATAAADMASLVTSGMPGFSNAGLDKVIAASAGMSGLAYLTEMTMNVEGTGPMVEVMRQMASMKLTMKVTDISTAPLLEDIFAVPADFKVVK